MARDLSAILQGFIADLSEGKGATSEFFASLNTWGRDFSEGLREKIESEVDRSVSKLGFIKRDEYDRLAARVALLEKASANRSPAKKVSTNKTKPKRAGRKVAKKSVSSARKAK
jgi:hypothetical protein